jgi:phage-related protein
MKISFFHEDIKSFLDALEAKMRAKVNATIKLLSMEAYHLSMPYSRKVEKNLYELRISSIQNIRIFYTFHDNKIVLLHAIYKKTDKLPLHDLNTARQRLYNLHS